LANLTIEDLKLQKRWVLWRLEKRDGKDTKVPYQPSGANAASNSPATWMTYADVEPHAHRFSGLGCVLGEVGGVHVCGVDIDNCCDAHARKFTPESREIVIGLDSYSEFSPSGTGVHILMLGTLRDRKGIKLPFPGTKAVELYDSGRYLTFTGRHLEKTPSDVVERQDAVNALYDRVAATKHQTAGLTVSISLSEEERLTRLMAGDRSLYKDDHSTADFALCCLLAKKHDCNAFKIDAEFRESRLYREKWERDDYRENTIARAIKSVAREAPVVFDTDGLGEDGDMEYLVEKAKRGRTRLDGFPRVS
jgi:primase-polymerase (primpol)-like protein